MAEEILCIKCKCILHEGSNWHESFAKKNFYLCKKCLKKKNQKVYLTDAQKIKKAANDRYTAKRNAGKLFYGNILWAARYLAGVKRNDRINGQELCDLNKHEILKFIDQDCTYCGSRYANIGMDRIDNKIGHIRTNIVPCCTICNTARMTTFTHEEMKILGKTIKKILEQRSKN